MADYNHREAEKKWQEKWEKDGIYDAFDDSPKEKEYLLVEFPYPSGNLHVGHWYAFSVPDILARYWRMKGKNVLFPIGFDAFGLPAENAAIERGLNPRKWTEDNINYMRKQLRSMGASFDWSREVITCDPKYYKWTQWLFLQFFKKGLAYRAYAPVNWCPNDKTVLANEQVVEGHCERCGAEVEKRNMLQWNLRITDYAERLIDDLAPLNWPEEIKTGQRNWIGRSEGAEIDFPLTWAPPEMEMVFATQNEGKLRRMQKLFAAAGLKITLKTPKEIGIKDFIVEENGKTLAENALIKARAVAEKTNLPVFADDSGFFIDGTEIDPITVKRNALKGLDEKSLTVEEIAAHMRAYYQNIAQQHGGKVEAHWINSLCFITPEKFAVEAEAVRPVILTDEVHGAGDPHLPVRPLYIAKASGKYALEQTEEEELMEMQPITDAVRKIFTPKITVFTTRPDTLFGATYLVLAPEHPLIPTLNFENKKEVKEYIKRARTKTEIERAAEGKEKTGVELKGVRAINPATKEEIPIYVADYVLGQYGTGAIMAVPAHDERDFEFAKKFGLPMKVVIARETGIKREDEEYRNGGSAIVFDPKEQKYAVARWEDDGRFSLFAGGVGESESVRDAILREVREESGLGAYELVEWLDVAYAHYFHKAKKVNRIARAECLLVVLKDNKPEATAREAHENFELAWRSADEIRNNWEKRNTDGGYSHYLAYLERGVARAIELGYDTTSDPKQFSEKAFTESGIVENSGPFDGMPSEEVIPKITEKYGRKKVSYKLRDWVVSRQRYWGVPIPIVHCKKCGAVAVPDKELPVELPEIKDYLPEGDGKSPLAKTREWVEVKCPQCKGKAERETDTLDTFVDSSWYFLRYLDPNNEKEFASQKKTKEWMPVNLYSGGAEHTTMHLLYSRFFHKVLFDLGLVGENEPYKRRMNRGLIMGPDGQKMSKSRGNVIDPDKEVQKLGADAVRMYLAFIGPYNEVGSYPWNPSGTAGIKRFLDRVWRLQGKISSGPYDPSHKNQILLQETLKGVGEDIERLKFNTAISKLMILLNALEKENSVSVTTYGTFLSLLAPFAPHLCEEVYREFLKGKNSIHMQSWPNFSEEILKGKTVIVAVQINGKVRGFITADPGAPEEKLTEMSKQEPNVAKWLEGKTISRTVVVPGRLVNFVVDN